MLPLSDRVLMRLNASPQSARQLARALAADPTLIHNVLRGLHAQGTVIPSPVPGQGDAWRLAPGVRVEYRPGSVVVTGVMPATARPELPTGRCMAIAVSGKPCCLRPLRDDRCFLHTPKTEPPSSSTSSSPASSERLHRSEADVKPTVR